MLSHLSPSTTISIILLYSFPMGVAMTPCLTTTTPHHSNTISHQHSTSYSIFHCHYIQVLIELLSFTYLSFQFLPPFVHFQDYFTEPFLQTWGSVELCPQVRAETGSQLLVMLFTGIHYIYLSLFSIWLLLTFSFLSPSYHLHLSFTLTVYIFHLHIKLLSVVTNLSD